MIWTCDVRRIVNVRMKAWIAWGVIDGERNGDGDDGLEFSRLGRERMG
jgi:hypothetical protein